MLFFDTHIHLSDFDDTEAVLKEALSCGIDKMINMSAMPKNWQKVLDLSRKYPQNIVPAIGIHPWYVGQAEESYFQDLGNMLKENSGAVLGECGLDGLKPDFAKQIDVFLRQTELAKKYNRPLIVHAVKASDWFQNNWNELPERFVFHSYNGKTEFLKQILNHAGYVGFNASVLKSKSADEVLKYVPKERILLETDAPYQGFEKGKENRPCSLPMIFQNIAEVRGENEENFAETVYQNSLDFIK